MPFTDSRIQAAAMLLVSLAINLVFLYGVVARPVISYHLSTPLDYNGTIDFEAEALPVELRVRNKGLSPARVRLVVRFYNMSPVGAEGWSLSEEGGVSEARLPWRAPARQSEPESFAVTFDSRGNATYALLIFYIEVDRGARPLDRFHNSFITYRPERPTAILLRHISDTKFMRVKRR
ncbi:hypothetical protein DRO42_06875 [Candidatus Bathyarchaeota archaeon]|nr:MAG: hypothetical protein DRO42_06875 [Candidatus Bathyarchaeota archaeon]